MRKYVACVALLSAILVFVPGSEFLADDVAPPPGQFRIRIQGRLPANGRVAVPNLGIRRRDAGGIPPTRLAPPDRTLRQRLKRVSEAVQADNLLEATETLQQFLDRDEEVFLPSEDENAPPQSLKRVVLRQLTELSAAGQEMYELKNGPAARNLLNAALEENQPDKLVQLARRYLHTAAGSEGTYRLASLQLDQGEFLSAARLFDSLRQFASPGFRKQFEPSFSLKSAMAWQELGETEKAEDVIRDLQQRTPRPTFTLGGDNTPLQLKSPEQILAWLANRKQPAPALSQTQLADWRMVRGDIQHNAGSRTQAPYLNSVRTASLLENLQDDPARSAQLAREYAELSTIAANTEVDAPVRPAIPALQPLAVGGLAVVRTFSDLRAYRLTTGELAWISAEKDDMLSRLVQAESARPSNTAPFLPPMGHALKQRAWRDSTYGSLSSDGKLVYAIEEADFIGSYFARHPGQIPGPHSAREVNRLKAYDLQTGRLAAEFPAADDPGDNNRVFFLGPPLPMDDRLYCLAESLGEIRLMVFRAESPVLKLEWSMPLVSAMPLDLDPYRRMCGLTPVASGGLLICPTEAGAVVAVDLTTRSFAWGYVYDSRSSPNGMNVARQQAYRLASNYQQFMGNDEFRWTDSAVVIHRDRVVLTARDVDDLQCLNLADGKLLWKIPRESGLCLASVYDGKAIVISRGEGAQAYAQAYDLANGKAVWSRPTSLPLPSGQGYRHGEFYYLPATTAEVITLNLTNGQIVTRSRSQQKMVPGNLVASGDTIVSQTPDTLHLFPQFDVIEVEVAKRLQKNPRDAAALALRGEIELQRGRTQAALASFREALSLKADERPYRELLLSSLLEGLRVDFPTYRAMSGEIERLEPRADQWGSYLLALASGLEKSRETVAAFQTYLRFFEPQVQAESLERVNDNQVVRRDLFASAQIRRIYREAATPLRKELDEVIKRNYATTRDRGNPAELTQWLITLPEQIPATEARRILLDRSSKKDSPLERERLFREVARSSDKATAGAALNKLIALLVEEDRAVDALGLIEQLKKNYRDVALQDGKTGAALAEEWAKQPAVAREFKFLRGWPTGLVETRREPKPPAAVGFPSSQVPIQECGESYLSGMRLEMSRRADELNAWDRFGREWWSLELDGNESYIDTNQVRAWTMGHLLLVAMPRRLLAIDTLSLVTVPGEIQVKSPRLLWQLSLSQRPLGGSRYAATPGGRARFKYLDENNLPTGSIGPVTERFIGVQRGKKLLGVEPLTGKVLWIRDDAGIIDELTGDEEMVVSLPIINTAREEKDAPQARVYSTIDGALLGTRPLPQGKPQALIGRSLLNWKEVEEKGPKRLSMWDIWNAKNTWERDFAPGAVLYQSNENEVAVMESLGRLCLLKTSTGQSVWETKLEPDPALQNLVLLRGLERTIAIVSGPVNQTEEVRVQQIDTNLSIPVSGTIYGLEHDTGRQLWSIPLEPQALNPLQSADLPILVFACRSFVRQPTRRFQSAPAIACIDTRSGRIVYQERISDDQVTQIRITARPDVRIIDLHFTRTSAQLKLTDLPIPPKEAAKDSEKPSDPPQNPEKNDQPKAVPAKP